MDPKVSKRILGRGLAGAPGVAVGKAVFTSAQAAECHLNNEPCILVVNKTTAKDVDGLQVGTLESIFVCCYYVV